jgi:hypothetical protein
VTPERLRAYVLIAVRDIVIPMAGVFLSIVLPITDRFEYWHLPLIAGMLGVPLVARGGEPPDHPMPDVTDLLPPASPPASQEDS